MAKYLNYAGLQKYDSNIKQYIADNTFGGTILTSGECIDNGDGTFKFEFSSDDGSTFETSPFFMPAPVRFLHVLNLDCNYARFAMTIINDREETIDDPNVLYEYLSGNGFVGWSQSYPISGSVTAADTSATQAIGIYVSNSVMYAIYDRREASDFGDSVAAGWRREVVEIEINEICDNVVQI